MPILFFILKVVDYSLDGMVSCLCNTKPNPIHYHYNLPVDPQSLQPWVYDLVEVWTYDLCSPYNLQLPIGLHLDEH